MIGEGMIVGSLGVPNEKIRLTKHRGFAGLATLVCVVILVCSPAAAAATRAPHDFNGDGKSDLLWRQESTGATVMWLMDGSTILSAYNLGGSSDWTVAATGDFNGDGYGDLLWRQASTGTTLMWLMNGASLPGILASSSLGGSADWSVLATGDFNGDGRTDLLWRQASTGATVMWLMNGSTVMSAYNLGGSSDWSVAATGDFNGDGYTDLVWRQASTGATVLWLMNGSSLPNVLSIANLGGSADWSVTLTGDFNGDGRTDLVWRQASTGSAVVWFMNGTSVTAVLSLGGSTDWSAVGSGDFNGDGRTDLLWHQASTGFTVLWLLDGATSGSVVESVASLGGSSDWSVTESGGTIAGPGSGLWTWESGANTLNAPNIFGTQDVAAPGNAPGARYNAMSWATPNGGLWLFGGQSTDIDPGPVGNDLWFFNPAIAQWTWTSGSQTSNAIGIYGTQSVAASTNVPGARTQSATWIDAAGNLWLFGGTGFDSQGTQDLLNDLWKYDTSTGEWTWVSGYNVVDDVGVYGTQGVPGASNVPPGRAGARSWVDKSGNLWLFAGASCCILVGDYYEYYDLNDLWRFNPATGEWTWMGGSQSANPTGVYGTQGVAAANNVPGARSDGITWTDATGNFWLFGGGEVIFTTNNPISGTSYLFSDLWKYSPSTSQWTWVSGPKTPNAAGSWGAQGVAGTANIPSARESSASWVDTTGNLWLMGGLTFDPTTSTSFNNLNDLWKFSPVTGQWTWLGGIDNYTAPSTFGDLGVPGVGNGPGGRYGASGWTDPSGNFWLFGGLGADGISDGQYTIYCCLNDLWKFHP